MPIEWKIAWRYLFSKKSHNAINIVSGVSAAAVCVVTAAMVCVLSVMNGFGSLVEDMFSQFDPPIRITSAEGKAFSLDTEPFHQLRTLPSIQLISEAVTETALVCYKEHQTPAYVMGVDEHFQALTSIDSIINDGYYSVYDGAFYRTVVGRGLAAQIGINPHFVGGIKLYAPKRLETVNLLRPDEAFHEEMVFIAGTFAVNQVQYDDRYMLISIRQARQLFDYDSTMVTSLAIQPAKGTHVRVLKREIQSLLGAGYLVEDRYEQQSDFFRMLKVEKLLTTLLLVFILLIACFNIISSLSMLILDKKESIAILSHLGASPVMIRRIFRYEGWMISSLGALMGLILGVVLCLMQQEWGLIKLGTGTNYIISAYPVQVQGWDIVIIGIAVIVLGFLAAAIPTRKLFLFIPLLGGMVACHPTPEPVPSKPTELYLTHGEMIYYGVYYDSVPRPVVTLDLYSEGITLDSLGYMQGNGYNLYLSDIFLPATDTVLTPGDYHCDSTTAARTFLRGMDFEGNPTGTYLLQLSESRMSDLVLMDKGDFSYAVEDDSIRITFHLSALRKDYTIHFNGALRYEQRGSHL